MEKLLKRRNRAESLDDKSLISSHKIVKQNSKSAELSVYYEPSNTKNGVKWYPGYCFTGEKYRHLRRYLKTTSHFDNSNAGELDHEDYKIGRLTKNGGVVIARKNRNTVHYWTILFCDRTEEIECDELSSILKKRNPNKTLKTSQSGTIRENVNNNPNTVSTGLISKKIPEDIIIPPLPPPPPTVSPPKDSRISQWTNSLAKYRDKISAAQAFIDKRQRRLTTSSKTNYSLTPRTLATQRWLDSIE